MDPNLNKCRACLSEAEGMLSLYQLYEHDLTLAMILQSCVNTEVREGDGLPSHLCDSCILVLTQFYNFTVVFEESDKQLRKLLKKHKTFDGHSHELQASAYNINEATNAVEVEINDACNDNALNEVVAVDFGQDHVMSDCNSSENVEFYEYKNIECNFEEQDQSNSIPDYGGVETETVQEFKKEIILPEEEFEQIEDDADYSTFHMLELQQKDSFIKNDKTIKTEGPSYEEVTKYECTICGESHLYASGFQQHMRNKHSLSDIDCKDYASQIQIKVYPNSDTADKVEVLFPEKAGMFRQQTIQKCRYCHKELFANQLPQHLKIHETNKKFVCEVCGARFIRKTYLDDHMEGHSTEKKHVCKFCGKAFRRRTVLRAHKRVHTHPNHYVCEQCGRAFTNSSTLKTHKLLIHVRERNFQCVICNLKFPLKSTLNKHVLRHQKRENGEKGFSCTECDMQYRDKSSLKRHTDTKHQGRIQLVSCEDCPKKYTSKANLMKHRRRHHSGINLIEILSV